MNIIHSSIIIAITAISAQTNECPTDSTFVTDMYAGQPLQPAEVGILKNSLNLGQITGIIKWGKVYGTGNLAIHGFRVNHDSDSTNTHSNKLGDIEIEYPCTPFDIPIYDFISGYTIGYDATSNPSIITNLTFHTNSGHSYSCSAGHGSTNTASWNSNDCAHDYYLSGWNYTSGHWLNTISFQFTQFISPRMITDDCSILGIVDGMNPTCPYQSDLPPLRCDDESAPNNAPWPCYAVKAEGFIIPTPKEPVLCVQCPAAKWPF